MKGEFIDLDTGAVLMGCDDPEVVFKKEDDWRGPRRPVEVTRAGRPKRRCVLEDPSDWTRDGHERVAQVMAESRKAEQLEAWEAIIEETCDSDGLVPALVNGRVCKIPVTELLPSASAPEPRTADSFAAGAKIVEEAERLAAETLAKSPPRSPVLGPFTAWPPPPTQQVEDWETMSGILHRNPPAEVANGDPHDLCPQPASAWPEYYQTAFEVEGARGAARFRNVVGPDGQLRVVIFFEAEKPGVPVKIVPVAATDGRRK